MGPGFESLKVHQKTKNGMHRIPFFVFIQSKGLVCNLTAGEYGIAVGVWHHAPACIFLRIDAIHHFVMIPYGTSCQFHTATSCGFHTRLWRDFSFEFETLLRNGKNIFFLFYDIGTTTFGRRHASRLCIPLAVYCQARRCY